eukprot:2313095-Rhodomonas_salina.1
MDLTCTLVPAWGGVVLTCGSWYSPGGILVPADGFRGTESWAYLYQLMTFVVLSDEYTCTSWVRRAHQQRASSRAHTTPSASPGPSTTLVSLPLSPSLSLPLPLSLSLSLSLFLPLSLPLSPSFSLSLPLSSSLSLSSPLCPLSYFFGRSE